MAKKDTKKKRRIMKEEPVARNCPFDKNGTEPDYKDTETLMKYMTDRAKVLGKDRTGLCSKHQKRLTVAIKRARHLGLLPYIPALS